MSGITVGVLLALVAGVLNGSFAAPTKYSRLWNWENIWAIWAVMALFVLPWALAWATIPGVWSLYESAGPRPLLLLLAFGIGNGVAQICFGLGLATLGLSLGFAIAIGVSTVFGSLGLLLILQPHMIFTVKGLAISAGVALILIGIVVCAVAGRAKEKLRRGAESPLLGVSSPPRNLAKGLFLAVIAGILSSTTNFGLAFGGPLLSRAAERGVSTIFQANIIWPPLLTATLIPYLAYCARLARNNNSLRLYKLPGTRHYWVFGMAMGLLWMGSLFLYGAAASFMSTMGPVLGWPLFLSVTIITSNGWGFATGEWKGASQKPVVMMLAGIVFLILGICVLAFASR